MNPKDYQVGVRSCGVKRTWKELLGSIHSELTNSHIDSVSVKSYFYISALPPFFFLCRFLCLSLSLPQGACEFPCVSVLFYAFVCVGVCLSLFHLHFFCLSKVLLLRFSPSFMPLTGIDFSASKCTKAINKALGLVSITSQGTKDD